MTLTYGLLLFEDAEELDVVGPWEVMTASGMYLTSQGDDPTTAVMIAATMDPVRCAKGMQVLPHHTFDDHPDLDVVLVPGGQGTRTQVHNERLLGWLADVGTRTVWNTSVCTGSLLLVASGLASGRRVATHWGFEDTLAERDDCTVVRDARWVRDGNVVTSQGGPASTWRSGWSARSIRLRMPGRCSATSSTSPHRRIKPTRDAGV